MNTIHDDAPKPSDRVSTQPRDASLKGHTHAHAQHHMGHHHVHEPSHYGFAFIFGITLNLLVVAIEVIWGSLSNSLSLLSDAGHNFSDVLGLALSWIAHTLATRSPTRRFTYGYKRLTILSALGNAALLLLVTGALVAEAIGRLFHPVAVGGQTVMIVAMVSLLVNGVTAWAFLRGNQDDLNVKSAFIHLAADAGMSLAVVITGFMIWLSGWVLLDPLISLGVSLSIIAFTWSLLRRSLDLSLDGVPTSIDLDALERALSNLHGVTGFHHLHVWPLSTTQTALTVHLVTDADQVQQDAIIRSANTMLRETFAITHATLQIEFASRALSCDGKSTC